ncbi:MAG: hypothetical protein M1818_005257 [Claussenomyces sp. TS43310]|nr:MAG: hypothetical protein M1818_005257 [Claussenomyces sp. TS43310]
MAPPRQTRHYPWRGEESETFLPQPSNDEDEVEAELIEREESASESSFSRAQARHLYVSHLLSTWNARTYEFAAILFTAATYPDTLAASAIRGIVTTIASICVSSSVGRWIDGAPNRLNALLTTITTNRLSVMAACACWYFMVGSESGNVHERAVFFFTAPRQSQSSNSEIWRGSLFATVVILGIFEKLSGAGNLLSMERDWVVTLAAPSGNAYDLTHLNAVMRRIDLICKLVAPIFISAIISTTASVQLGVLIVGAMSASSWGFEWLCAKRVWNSNSRLRTPKTAPAELASPALELHDSSPVPQQILPRGRNFIGKSSSWLEKYCQDFKSYFSSIIWIPSMALCLLHLTVLSYSATLITYLLNAGFSLNLITIARAAGSVAEIGSTLVTPFGVEYLGRAHHHHHHHSLASDIDDPTTPHEHDPLQGSVEIGLERLGLWGVTWQFFNLIPVVVSLWALSPNAEPAILISYSPPLLPALTLFTFLSMSRLGLWIFDLTTQQLTQTLVEPSQRLAFAGVENSFASTFELGNYVAAIIFSRPSEFTYLATGSLAAVGLSTLIYAGWVWKMRGHLLHWERVGKGCDCVSSRRHGVWRSLRERLRL